LLKNYAQDRTALNLNATPIALFRQTRIFAYPTKQNCTIMPESAPKYEPKSSTSGNGDSFESVSQDGKSLKPPGFDLTDGTIQSLAQAAPTNLSLVSGVGVKGPNLVSDLKAIQNRLKSLGFLADADYVKENTTLLKDLKDTDKVDATKIPATIAAIKEYERVVLYQVGSSKFNKPTGQITKSGDIVGMMNAQQAAPSATEISNVSKSRGTLVSSTTDGGDFTMTGKVGRVTNGNHPDDLQIIQNRLVALGKLKTKDRETETLAALTKKYNTIYKGEVTSIQEVHIPKTIAAIEAFQSKGQFEHTFWQKRKFNGQDLSKYTWVKGVVEKTDLSGFILTHYRKTQFNFNDADSKALSVTATNFVKSDAATDGIGYSVIGTAEPTNFTAAEFKAFGISDLEARSLLFVSKNEGKFNAVNTWDKAAVSFGFVQFAGGSGGGSYPKMMANLKKDSPDVFTAKFKKYGIDVEYTLSGDKIGKATILAIDPAKNKVLRGLEAEAYIRGLPGLMPVFLSAGYDKDVQKAQVKTSVEEYVVPSRSSKFTAATDTKYLKCKKDGADVILMDKEAVEFSKSEAYKAMPEADKGKLTDLSLNGEKIGDYLTGEKARAVVIDLAINAGLGGCASKMSQGMKAYISKSKTVDKTTMKAADEVEILKSIKPFANFPERVQKAIDDASLSAS
jgi:hypothetical protein